MLVSDLEKEIITLRVQNRYAALRLQNIQDEIEHFSAQYYTAIEDICLSLVEIEGKIRNYENKIKITKDQVIENIDFGIYPRENKPAIEEKLPHEHEVKDVYRSLIKLVHPDVSEEKLKAAEYTMMVNKAYNERNYRQLVELDLIIRSGTATEHELRQQRNMLIDSTFEMKIQRENLLSNPIYQLSEQFAKTADGGLEMIQIIRNKLQEHVAERKHEVLNLRIAYLDLIGELIAANA